MSADLLAEKCRRCGYGGAWLLRPVRELGHDMVVETVSVPGKFIPGEKHLGWYEAAVCAGCGHTLFWARDYAPARVPTDVEACVACGVATAWIVDAAPDRLGGWPTPHMRVDLAPTRFKASTMLSHRAWSATLGVRVCYGCGLASWSCRPDPQDPEDVKEGRKSARACVRCAGPQWLVAVRDQQSERTTDRGVAVHHILWFPTARGRFVADVCCACFTVDWYGTELSELRQDDAGGVSWLDRGGIFGGDGGPYR